MRYSWLCVIALTTTLNLTEDGEENKYGLRDTCFADN